VRFGPSSAEVRAAACWFAAFAVLSGGYAVLAPVVDDWRSALRPMRADCRVLRVLDGDTVELACPEEGWMRARIVGYDAPERFSPACEAERAAAARATRVLGAWVRQATRVEAAVLGRDRYGRRLVDMRLSGLRVARRMVETGNGRRYFGSLRGGWCR
jgi:endonuclease YncB( thermonuclease family)